MTQLDDNKADIVARDRLAEPLALSVRKQQGSIDAALEELPSALTLDRQAARRPGQDAAVARPPQRGRRPGDQGVQGLTIETLRQLDPVLTELANSGDDFVKAFNVFLTYPFVDEVVGRDPQVARNLHMGDYTNLSIELDVSTARPAAPDVCVPSDLPTDSCPTAARRRRQLVQDCLATRRSEVRCDPGPDPRQAWPDAEQPVVTISKTPAVRSAEVEQAASKECTSLNRSRKLAKQCKKKKNKDNPVCTVLGSCRRGGGCRGGADPLPTGVPTLPPPGLRCRAATANWSTAAARRWDS